MPLLKIEQGSSRGRIIPLHSEQTMLGRHPKSDIVIDNVAVSRHHAQIIDTDGVFFVEDLSSRNGTIVNGETISGKTKLEDCDRIQICDVIFTYYLNSAPSDSQVENVEPLHAGTTLDSQKIHLKNDNRKQMLIGAGGVINEDGVTPDSDSSIIVAKLSADGSGSSWRLSVKPAEKLKAILKLSRALRSTSSMDETLACILETMFRLFPQAEEGFIILRNPDDDQLLVRTTLIRNKQHDQNVHYSMMIVRTAMQSQKGLLSSDAAEDMRFRMSESIQQLEIRSMMCAPIVGTGSDLETAVSDPSTLARNRSIGVIQIGTKQINHQFNEDDLDIMVSVTSQAALAIEHAQLQERSVLRKTVDREMELAREIQTSFLPRRTPQVTGYEFRSHYRPALNVGGDYFDYVSMSDGRVAVTVADVAGKGVPAALIMARLSACARRMIAENSSPADALMAINNDFAESGLTERMITMAICVIDSANHEITVASAGHPAVLLCSVDGDVEEIGSRDDGIPLGIVDSQQISETKTSFPVGATCLLYSDGVSEALNSAKDRYELIRIRQFVENYSGQPGGISDALIQDVLQFQGPGVEQHDDMCLVSIYRPK